MLPSPFGWENTAIKRVGEREKALLRLAGGDGGPVAEPLGMVLGT